MIFAEQRGINADRDVVMLHGVPSAPASMWRIGGALVDVARATNLHMPGHMDSVATLPRLELSRLDLPVLARVGELDQATPVALTDALVAARPRATKQIVRGVGHAILLEDELRAPSAPRANRSSEARGDRVRRAPQRRERRSTP